MPAVGTGLDPPMTAVRHVFASLVELTEPIDQRVLADGIAKAAFDSEGTAPADRTAAVLSDAVTAVSSMAWALVSTKG